MKMWKVCVKFQPLPEARHLLSESGSWNGNAMRAICRESKNAGVLKMIEVRVLSNYLNGGTDVISDFSAFSPLARKS